MYTPLKKNAAHQDLHKFRHSTMKHDPLESKRPHNASSVPLTSQSWVHQNCDEGSLDRYLKRQEELEIQSAFLVEIMMTSMVSNACPFANKNETKLKGSEGDWTGVMMSYHDKID